MTGTIVRILPDGEELVVERRAKVEEKQNPRERILETRRRAVALDGPPPPRNHS